jgi:hypothetical protein
MAVAICSTAQADASAPTPICWRVRSLLASYGSARKNEPPNLGGAGGSMGLGGEVSTRPAALDQEQEPKRAGCEAGGR